MTRRTQFTGSAAGRRRERRAHLQSEASADADVLHRPTPSRVVLQCRRKPTGDRPGVIMQKARREVEKYRSQLIRATHLYGYEFGRQKMTEGSYCLAETALYNAGHRKVAGAVTAR